MRCATCGTENAPDSRFCGGCGAKLAPSSRVAPTAKIHDDAPYPSQPYQPAPASAPPGAHSGPASIPPTNAGPASIPPQHAVASIPPANAHGPTSFAPNAPTAFAPNAHGPTSIAPPGSSMQPMGSRPPADSVARPTPVPNQRPSSEPVSISRAPTPLSESLERRRAAVLTPPGGSSIVAPPARPIGLMVFVLLVDLALAGTGGMLLAKGLSDAPAKPTKPVQKTEATPPPPPTLEARASNIETSSGAAVSPPPTPAPAPAPGPAPSKVATKETAARAVSAKPAAKSATPSAPQSSAPAPQAAAPRPSGPVTSPEDPYAEVPFETQLDRKTDASKSAFDRCAADAGAPHGSIKIAFRVLADGRVANAAAVEDSTGSPTLSRCLAQTISTWNFTPRAGEAINSLRAFNYP